MRLKPPRPSIFSSCIEGVSRLLMGGVAAGVLYRDWKELPGWGMSDLRNRIVGFRAAEAGKDPYTFHWKPGDSERFIDPDDHPLRRFPG